MPVNQPTAAVKSRPSAAPSPASGPGVAPEGRLFLRPEELDRSADLLFAAVRQTWKAADHALANHKLGPAHYRALAAIRRDEGKPVSVLLARLGVAKQSLARVLNELEKAQLITRAPGELDRRQRLLCLTDAGREAEQEAAAAMRDRLGKVFRTLDPDIVNAARSVLSALAAGDAAETER